MMAQVSAVGAVAILESLKVLDGVFKSNSRLIISEQPLNTATHSYHVSLGDIVAEGAKSYFEAIKKGEGPRLAARLLAATNRKRTRTTAIQRRPLGDERDLFHCDGKKRQTQASATSEFGCESSC